MNMIRSITTHLKGKKIMYKARGSPLTKIIGKLRSIFFSQNQ